MADPLAVAREKPGAALQAPNAHEAGGDEAATSRADLNYIHLLPSLLSTGESRQLAVDLATLIARGDIQGAQRLLTAAVEAGTLASLLMDQIAAPGLLPFLRGVE